MLASLLLPLSTAVAAAGLLPLPIPGLPTTPPTSQPTAQQVPVSGVLDAADGRLKRGCKDYRYAYAVTTASDDWSFDISMRDSTGRGVNAQSLLGPNDPKSGVLTYRLCRWSAEPGVYTITGTAIAYDGEVSTSIDVAESFVLRRGPRH